ncbi:MAG: transcription antitermination factor NusB [Alphaproteobacteria bacterium]
MSRPKSTGQKRRASRLAAVQALYEVDLTEHPASMVIDAYAQAGYLATLDEGGQSQAEADLFTDIVRGVATRRVDLDGMLQSCLQENRTVERMEPILRAILRSGSYELSARGDIDAALTIGEYVALAHAFFDGPEPKIVNGVLERLARTLRPDDFEVTADAG